MSQSGKSNQSNAKVGITEKIGFGLGDLATNLAWASMSMFIVYFYTDVIGVAAGIIGTIILCSRFLDGISDIAMGGIVDKTKSKHGKARPWVLWLSIPFAGLMVALFAVPDVGTMGKVIYIAITYNLLILLYTAVVIPYGTLNTLITSDQDERGVLNVYRMFFASIGVIVVSTLTLPVVNLFGGGQSAWIAGYSVFAVVAVIMYIITFKTTKERASSIYQDNKEENNDSFIVGFKALFKNKYWVITFFIFIAYYVNDALYSGGTVYFAQYILGDPLLVGTLTMSIYIPPLLLMPFVAPMIKKIGKRKSMMWGTGIFLLGSLVILMDPTNLTVVMIGVILRGIGRTPIFGSIFALLPDTVEYGEWKTGVRREGLVYSGGSMGTKVGVGIGSAFVGWILGWGGYIGGQEMQADSALFAINSLFIYLPIITYVILFVLLYFYKLDKEYPKIFKELQMRKTI
ncbi:MFS transporter [Gracilibacillus timonensis]|uniref:MFS transporter n=1 Tax=Gracilibacillus timonensis TaxID=1816696 RepID=UPI000826A7BE|nr:MFS transporter [Gracilibacillus timonensis]